MSRSNATGFLIVLFAMTIAASASESNQKYTDCPTIVGNSKKVTMGGELVTHCWDIQGEITRNTRLSSSPQSHIDQSVFMPGFATGSVEVLLTPYDTERSLMSLTVPPLNLH